MKLKLAFFFVLLVLPMAFLNPLGRSAFIGFYFGAFVTWLCIMFFSHRQRKA